MSVAAGCDDDTPFPVPGPPALHDEEHVIPSVARQVCLLSSGRPFGLQRLRGCPPKRPGHPFTRPSHTTTTTIIKTQKGPPASEGRCTNQAGRWGLATHSPLASLFAAGVPATTPPSREDKVASPVAEITVHVNVHTSWGGNWGCALARTGIQQRETTCITLPHGRICSSLEGRS